MGLGRRNNELHELTNCVDALGRQGNNKIYLASDGVTTNYTN